MSKKRLTIISGAGAVIDWGAKSTKQITDELRNNDTFKSITGNSIGNIIYDTLTSHYHKQPELVNFETIIDAVETIHTFLFSKYKSSVNEFKSSKPSFFDLKDDFFVNLMDFNRIYEKSNNSFKSDGLSFGLFYWKDYDEFILNVWELFANIVASCVRKYANPDKNLEYTDLNKSLTNYFEYYTDNYIIRFYTLNYDKIPIAVTKFNFFEGFTDNKFDSSKVISDLYSDCYYNLHGSLYYNIDDSNREISLRETPLKKIKLESLKKDLSGNSIPNSQILTGLNKASQVLTYPYNLFYNALMYDLRNADEIHFIGYSFNDYHINNILDKTLNPDKVFIVDYIDFWKDSPEKYFLLDNNKRINGQIADWMLTQYAVLMNYPFLNKTKVFFKGFSEFLIKEQFKTK